MTDDLALLAAGHAPIDAPTIALPDDACDCHGHVFGRPEAYPLAPGKPGPVAPIDLFEAAHAAAGLSRAVIVQASSYAFDNRALIDAVGTAPDRLRGIAVPSPQVSDEELSALAGRGVAGLRFVQISGFLAPRLIGSSLDFAHLAALGPRLGAHGLHANLWGDCDLLLAAEPAITTLRVPVVVDHMLGASAERGVEDPGFRRLIAMARDLGWWVKLCPIRVSKQAPDYADARPFHDALIGAIPDQLLWCSDWPFLGLMGEARPTIGRLLDLFAAWTPDPALRRRILIDNPAALYGF